MRAARDGSCAMGRGGALFVTQRLQAVAARCRWGGAVLDGGEEIEGVDPVGAMGGSRWCAAP